MVFPKLVEGMKTPSLGKTCPAWILRDIQKQEVQIRRQNNCSDGRANNLTRPRRIQTFEIIQYYWHREDKSPSMKVWIYLGNSLFFQIQWGGEVDYHWTLEKKNTQPGKHCVLNLQRWILILTHQCIHPGRSSLRNRAIQDLHRQYSRTSYRDIKGIRERGRKLWKQQWENGW